MLESLRSKYKTLFLSRKDYNKKGVILSDDVIANSNYHSHPLPTRIPNFTIGHKIGEGLTSETYYFPHALAPFQLVVQFHPIEIQETINLIIISSLITQLYSEIPHITPFLGYYLASQGETKFSDDKTTSSSQEINLESDCYGLIYQKISNVFDGIPIFNIDEGEHKLFFAQLIFSIQLLHQYGFIHGDLNFGNIGWEKKPEWQGRKLLNYDYYGYMIGNQTYYLPSGPIVRIIDYNLTSYDGEIKINNNLDNDDFRSILVLAKLSLPEKQYLEIEEIVKNRNQSNFWEKLFGNYQPKSGDKVIILGKITES